MEAINDEFSQPKQEFEKINDVATEQKKQTDTINLIDDTLDEDNPFKNINTKDIQIEDDWFDDDDKQAVKNVYKEIIDILNPINNIPLETITIDDGIDIPSDYGLAIDAPKKVKIITTNSNQLGLASNRIKKKYVHQKSRQILKKANEKADDWLRKVGVLGTDDLETINHNNDTNINDLDDVETINYNNNTNINDLDNVNLEKTSRAQIAAEKIVKKHRNLARKKTYQRRPQNTFDDLADLETIDYNNDTSISDLNDIAAGSKKISGMQIAARKII